ncbi:MAG TPA: DUF4238 domain-containing protein [Bauldia sp.]
MNPSRDHHFVPVFYLKQWVGPSGKLIEYSQKQGKLIPKPVGPQATGFERHLNSFPELPPELAEFLEDEFFKSADNDAALVLQKMLAGALKSLDGKQRSAWSRFLIGTKMRHPDSMSEFRAHALKLWRQTGVSSQAEYEKIRNESDPATFDDYIAARDPLTEVKAQVRLISKAIDNEILGKRINSAIWAVLDVSNGPNRLLTSDRPLEIFKFQEPTGMLAIPISPKHLFVASFDRSLINKLVDTNVRELVTRSNDFVVSRARRFAYANNELQELFIAKRFGTRKEAVPFFPTLA